MAPHPAGKLKLKPWYAIFEERFNGDEPWFLDPQDYPEVMELEHHWKEIYEEVKILLEEKGRLKPYPHHAMSFPPGDWKALSFLFWGLKVRRNRECCPKLIALLNQIPHLTAASLSVLEPKTKIHPHFGDTNAIARIHLGLDIPGSAPDCAFQVGEEIRSWHNGTIHLFTDAHFHMAWNYTEQRRVILILDVMRPEFAHQERAICAHVLGSMLLLSLYNFFPFIKKTPLAFKRLLMGIFTPIMRCYIPLQQAWSGRSV